MFDTTQPALGARMRAGDCLGLAWLATGSLPVAEAARRAAPCAVVLDLQHGLWDRIGVEAAIGMLDPLPVLARVPKNDAEAIGAVLDAGAQGVIVPLVESRAAAMAALAATRFPPHGNRSAGGCRPLADMGAYLDWARTHILCAVMIETTAGVDAVEAIASVPDLGAVFIGTGDLGLSMGCRPDDPEVTSVCARIRDTCAEHNLPCGIFTSDAKTASRMRVQGFAMTVIASDLSVLHDGFGHARTIWQGRAGKEAAE